MNAEDLANLLITHGKVDLLMRPGNDISKMLSVKYLKSSGQLYFTSWCPGVDQKLNIILPKPRAKLTANIVESIFGKLLSDYFVLDPPSQSGGNKLSETQSKVGTKLTAAQLKKLAACLPLAIKGTTDQPACIEKPKLSDVKEMLALGVSSNYEFQPEYYDKSKKKMAKKSKRSILQYALEQKKYKIAKLLLKHGANPNYVFIAGPKVPKQSLLSRMLSLGKDYIAAVKLLQEHGAKYTSDDVDGLTQRLLGTIRDSKKVQKMTLTEIKNLLKLGLSSNHIFQPNFYDKEKKKMLKKSERSILQYALEHNKIAIAKLLLEHGADANYIFTNTKGVKVALIHRIVSLRNVKSIELLLKHKVDINSQMASDKRTPLHIILLPFYNKTAGEIKQTIKLVKLFLDKKPNLFLKNEMIFDDKKIESTIVQSAHHLVKKMGPKLQKIGKQLTKMIDDYVSKLSVVERLIA